jgi:DNA-binding CsgD family transcriptional regulator
MDIAAAILLKEDAVPIAVNAVACELMKSPEWVRLHTEIHQRIDRSAKPALFPVHRSDNRPPLVVWLTPLAEFASGRNGMALCFVFDPEWQSLAATKVLQSTYRLTPAELRLAEQLLLGRRPSEAAEALGVTVHTVRTYLKRLYQKVGARTQAKLVRKLMQVVSMPGSIAA